LSLSPEDKAELATIAAQAAVAAVQAMGLTAPASSRHSKPAEELPEDPEDEAAAAETIRENEAKIAEIEQMATDLLPHIMEPRHLEVFRWMTGNLSNAAALRQIIRTAVAAQTPNWREAKNGFAGSTKNPATMAQIKGE
jgi:hypothetical protein